MKIFVLFATAAVALAAPALAAEKTSVKSEVKVEQDAQGNYEKKTSIERKDPQGTSSTETKTKVDVDGPGDTEKTVKTESVNDPKGLMNKTTVKTEDAMKHEDGKIVTKHKKKVNGKTVENKKTKTPGTSY